MRIPILTFFTLVALSVATPSIADVAAKPVTATSASPTKNTLLQQDLVTLIQAGQAMEMATRVKQDEMEKTYQPKVEQAKTAEQQKVLQKQFLKDVVAFKTLQKQKFAAVKLSEPRVMNLRNKVVETFDSDIAAAQIVIDNPTPTPETQKRFVEAITKSENLTQEVHDGLETLMKEAGMSKGALKPNK